MGNFWEFLLQTMTVSLAAGVLLVVKSLMADKLSPRWQYGIWCLLALRLLAPVQMTRSILLPLPLWMEDWKFRAEEHLASAFSGAFEPLAVQHPLPEISAAPQSLTDWLFVVYVLGVVGSLAWYAGSYGRLRWLLRRGTPVSGEFLAPVCGTYGLKPCKVVAVEGISSAFVCGLLRPVLAVPAEEAVDEKILLHELLHLKYRDALQNMLWCVFRSLHWCNPFLQFVFNRIGNDLESLCDQRVLERLEGEQRRDYGGILLAMANDRYARAPGTSSISNGGKNIARRIEAIVRFKKYPRGMALVSVCIAVVLASPLLLGTASARELRDYLPEEQELHLSMAMSRLERCTTVAGALDTYAKGLILESGVYLATASPLSSQEALLEEMRENRSCHVDSGWELEDAAGAEGYVVHNLKEQDDGRLEGLLLIAVNALLYENGDAVLDENGEIYTGDGYVILPVRIWQENGWVVEETGERTICTDELGNAWAPEAPVPFMQELTDVGARGTVTVRTRVIYQVDTWSLQSSFFGSARSFDWEPRLDAVFADVQDWRFAEYLYDPVNLQQTPANSVSIRVTDGSSMAANAPVPELFDSAYVTGGDYTRIVIQDDWDGTVFCGGGGGGTLEEDEGLMTMEKTYYVHLYWDDELLETFVLREEQP